MENYINTVIWCADVGKSFRKTVSDLGLLPQLSECSKAESVSAVQRQGGSEWVITCRVEQND